MSQEHILHQAEAHAQGAHELPNLITLLDRRFPNSGTLHFLHCWENVFFAGTIAALILGLAVYASKKNRLVPIGIQNFFEVIVEFMDSFVTGILGKAGRKHIPFLGTLFLYILLMNWSGLIPLMKSPTSAWSTTFAIGLVTMIYIQISGIREQGLAGYIKHMAGNPSNVFSVIMIPLMLVLNIILEYGAVPFSLSLRLFANISSEDRLILKFAELNVQSHYLLFLFQLFANILSVIFSLVQAFVFMLLSAVYLALVMPHEDHHSHPAKNTAAV